MTDAEMIFKRIRNIALKKPYRSSQFRVFVMMNKHNMTFHHCFGSAMSLKSTDLLGVATDGMEHMQNQDNRDWLIEKIPEAIENLLRYVEYLESRLP